MNKLTIPSSPNWYENDIMACAPDDTLLYGSRQDLVVIKPTGAEEPNDVRVISKAHSMKIVSVNVNRHWGEPHKYAVTVSEDKIVKAWDVEKMEKISSHDKHISEESKIVGASFAGDVRIVSASEAGSVTVWYLFTNETNTINSLFPNKVTVTCMSICPHASYLAVFGLKSGLIVVVDLRRTGKVLYSLRGHSKSVVSLVWCPAPVNIFPVKPLNKVVEKFDGEAVMLELMDDKGSEAERLDDKFSEQVSVVEENEAPEESSELLTSADKTSEENPLADREEVLPSASEETLLADTEEELPTADKSSEENQSLSPADKSSEAQQEPDDCDKSRRKQRNPKKQLNSGTHYTHCSVANEGEAKPPKTRTSVSKITEFLAKTQISDSLDVSGSSEESRQFCSASSCDNDLNCSKRTKEILEASPKKIENDVFYDAQEEDKPWRTEQLVHADEQPRKEFLLASSAREPNIYIWRAGTDGRMQTFMKVPPPKKTNNKKKAKDTLPWISLCWPTPTTLLSASHTAELLQWTLPKPTQNVKFFRMIHKAHWSVLFSIKAPIFYSDEYNFLQKRPANAWTTGMERNILNTDLDNGKTLSLYPAFGGSINCLDASPLDPNRLAIGSGEGVVYTWDLSRPHLKSVTFCDFYTQILSSVTALAWHPVMENVLAFGTTEGRVGVLDVAHKSRGPKILKHHFKSQIFKLEWGPADLESGKRGLFVVSESRVAIFDTESREREPEMLELPDNTSVFTMAWKPDYSMLLVSAKSGMIITYNPKLEIQNVAYLSNKLLSIKWHPDAVSTDPSESKFCKTLASLIKHSEIVIMDLNADEDHKIVAKLENRGVRIGDFAWSPHSGNFLVLVDDYGVAQVFDVATQTIVSTYMSPALDQLLCVHWSPLDPDYIVTGTVSHKIVVWKISENPPLTEKEINARRNKITKALQKEVGDLLTKEKEAKKVEAKEEPAKAKAASRSELVPLFYSPKENTWVQDMRRLLRNKLENNVEATIIGDSEILDIKDIFGDGGNVEKLFWLNLKNFKKQGHFKRANLLALFQGDLSEAIKEAIDHRRVDPWIISLCPMVSPRLWQTACDTYVQQLLEESEADPMEIVTYMLVGHQVEEAVHFLRERELYREAFLLAKGRFGADNSITARVAEEWAKKATYQGNFELAAGCYISLEKYGEAAAGLFRRSNVETLEFAAELAQLADNEKLHKAIVSRLNVFKPVEATKEETLSKDEVLLEELRELEETAQEILDVQQNLKDALSKEEVSLQVQETEEVSLQLQEKNSVHFATDKEITEKIAEVKESANLATDKEIPKKIVEEKLATDKEIVEKIVETHTDNKLMDTSVGEMEQENCSNGKMSSIDRKEESDVLTSEILKNEETKTVESIKARQDNQLITEIHEANLLSNDEAKTDDIPKIVLMETDGPNLEEK